jgi:hypothetical protein
MMAIGEEWLTAIDANVSEGKDPNQITAKRLPGRCERQRVGLFPEHIHPLAYALSDDVFSMSGPGVHGGIRRS